MTMITVKQCILIARIALGLSAPATALAQDLSATNVSAEVNPVPATSPGLAVTPSAEAAASRTQVSQQAVAASTESSSQPAAPASAAEFPTDQGLRMTFKDVQLSAVLDYMSKAAGFTIKPKPGLSINGKVTVWNDSPLTKEEAVDLLKHVLSDNGYTVIQDGKILTIISTFEAKKSEVPVKRFRTVDEIPRNTDVATYVIPVHTLNPIALVRNLQPLTSSETDLQANESANSLLMTDTQINIRRVAEIVTALDSVSSSVNSIKVYRLNYADSKALAGLVKELFPSSDARSTSTGGNGGNFARFGGGGGGRGGGGAVGFPGFGGATDNAGGGGASGQTPTSRVSAVSDDAGNALVVSAPEDLVSTIDQLVDKLDQPVDDISVMKLFHLTNADPAETVDLLANLFPEEDNSSSANRTPFQFGGFGSQGVVQAASGSGATGPSERSKKAGRVLAVADKRTQSVLVTTSRNLMPQIESMITELDANAGNKLNVHVVSLRNASPQAAMQIVQDLFASSSSTTSSSSQTDPLTTRSQTMLNNMMSSGAGSGSGGLNSGSASSGSTGGTR
jgi:type II secretory pathway component GspD/PulD (secretin)